MEGRRAGPGPAACECLKGWRRVQQKCSCWRGLVVPEEIGRRWEGGRQGAVGLCWLAGEAARQSVVPESRTLELWNEGSVGDPDGALESRSYCWLPYLPSAGTAQDAARTPGQGWSFEDALRARPLALKWQAPAFL